MIEAELKARVRDPEQLREQLGKLAAGENSTYHDTYYDWPGGQLTSAGRELRLRVVETAGQQRALLTYKEAAVDAASGSKPEHETEVAAAAAVDALFRGLGLVSLVAFEKHCTNYRFTARGRDMLATVVQVPELNGTFLELEAMTDEVGTQGVLADVRGVLHRLGITDDDLTTEQYTEAVLKRRR